MTALPRAPLLLTPFICAVLLHARAVDAQPSPLPEQPSVTDRAASVADVMRGLSAGVFTADSCTVEQGRPACDCLVQPDSAFVRWTPTEMTGLSLGPAHTGVHTTAASALLVDGIWVLADVAFYFPTATLHVDELHAQGADAQLKGLSWHEPAPAPPIACAGPPPLGAVRARAESASFAGGEWQVSGYRVGPWPVPMARSAHKGAPGLLPPIVRVTPLAAEFEGSVLTAGGVFALAAAGYAAPVSIGVGAISERQERAVVLRGLIDIQDEGVKPVVIGDLAYGGLTHIRGHVEHPSTKLNWNLRNAEVGGFFRDWRATHVGAAASGAGHALQISGGVLSQASLLEPAWSAILTYGTAFQTGRHAEWSVDIEHVSDADDTARHSTTTAVGLRVPLGWVERAWLRPGVDVLANYGAVTVARGFDASTTISLLGSAEVGLAVDGRFEGGRHRIAPVLRMGGELGGVQQRQAREGAPPYPYRRPDRWRWAAAVLEQSVGTSMVAFDVPVGVFADAFGDEDINSGLTGFGGFARAGARLAQTRADLAVACVEGCTQVGILASARIQARPGLSVAYSVSDLGDRDAALVFSDQLIDQGLTALRLISDSDAAKGISQVASLRARRGPAFARLYGRLAESSSGRGLGTDVGWRWEALGWGLGASAAWAPSGDWALSVGLTVGP